MDPAFNDTFVCNVPGVGQVARHLQLYRVGADRPVVLIVTDSARRVPDGEMLRRLRDRICQWFALDSECVHYVEHDPGAPGRRTHPADSERWSLVEFLDEAGDPPGRCPARRHPLRREHVERMAGGTLHAQARTSS